MHHDAEGRAVSVGKRACWCECPNIIGAAAGPAPSMTACVMMSIAFTADMIEHLLVLEHCIKTLYKPHMTTL